MTGTLLVLLLAAQPSRAAGVPETVLSLEDAQRLALLNDARFLSAQQDKIIAAERVKEAEYLFLPEFGLQASATKYEARYPFSTASDFRNILLFPSNSGYGTDTGNVYSGRGYMQMPLYEGGKTLNTLRLTQAAQKQANSNLESVRLDLLLSVQEVFYRLILAQEKLSACERQLAESQELFEKGRLDAWERLEAEAGLGEARSRAAEARHELDLSRLAFMKSINIELDTPFRVVGELKTQAVDVDVEKAALWAIELRPELQSETYKAQMDSIAVNLAAARRIPTVFVGGDYELTAESFPLRQNNWDASIGVKVPFSYDYWSQLRQKRAEQRQGQIKRAELQDRVRLEVHQACETLQYWQKEWPLREAQYRKVSGLYDEASRQGGQPLSKHRATTAVLNLRLSYLAAVTEHILARARLERAVGRSLEP